MTLFVDGAAGNLHLKSDAVADIPTLSFLLYKRRTIFRHF
jgi:hypothetical protein